MASLDNFLNKCLYLAEMPDRYGKTSSELIEIKNSINEFDQLQSTIKAQEEIIKRLKEDAIRLAERLEIVAEDCYDCQYCSSPISGANWDECEHTPTCPITLHTQLMNELGEK